MCNSGLCEKARIPLSFQAYRLLDDAEHAALDVSDGFGVDGG